MKGIFKTKRSSGSASELSTSPTNNSSNSPPSPSSTEESTSRKLSVRNIFKKNKDKNRLSTTSGLTPIDGDANSDNNNSNNNNTATSPSSDSSFAESPITNSSNNNNNSKKSSSNHNLTELFNTPFVDPFEIGTLCEPVNIHQKYSIEQQAIHVEADSAAIQSTLSSSSLTTEDDKKDASSSDTNNNNKNNNNGEGDDVKMDEVNTDAASEQDDALNSEQSDNNNRVIHLPQERPSDAKKWIRRVVEFAANVEEGELQDLCNVCAVSKQWYSVAAADKFWQPLVDFQMRERGYNHSVRKSARSKYLAMVNKSYETGEPESDDEGVDGPVVRASPRDTGSSKGSDMELSAVKQGKNQPVLSPHTSSHSLDSSLTDEATTPVSPSASRSNASSSAGLEPLDPAPFYSTDYRAITYKEDPEENIEWAMEDGKNQIECASLNKLVEMLTHNKEYDIFFMQTFILTFRVFTDQKTLIDKLVERFNMPPPRPDISFEDFALFKKNNLDKVRLRVTSTLKYWMESFFVFDFSDAEMLKRITEVIDMMEQSNSGALANMLRRTLDKMQSDNDSGRVKTEVKCPDLLKPKKSFFGKKKAFGILDYPLMEVARQLTLIDFDVFAKIEPKECLNQSWNKEFRVTKAPNINEMIQSFNKLSNWVGTEIVQREDVEKRVQVMEKMIELANHCKELNNFNATFSVVSGLNLASIYRLRNTWAAISEPHRQMYEDLNKYISRDFNFRFIRNALKNVKPPCIPYIGLYLTDLTFIEEGNPKYLNNKINFVRCRRFAEVIRDMQTYQNTRYALNPFPELQELLKSVTYLSEEDMYQQSLVVEARQKTKKKKAAEK